MSLVTFEFPSYVLMLYNLLKKTKVDSVNPEALARPRGLLQSACACELGPPFNGLHFLQRTTVWKLLAELFAVPKSGVTDPMQVTLAPHLLLPPSRIQRTDSTEGAQRVRF